MMLSEIIPLSIIARTVLLPPDMNAAEVVANQCSEPLNTNDIHSLHVVSEGRVWFLGAKSADFISLSTLNCPLAAAFPTHPMHQGDGIYAVEAEDGACALVRQGNSFSLSIMKPDQLRSYARDMKLDLYEIDPDATEGWEWSGRVIAKERAVARAITELRHRGWQAALITSILPVLAGIWLVFASTHRAQATMDVRQSERQSIALLSPLITAPMTTSLNSLHGILDFLADARGTLIRLTIKGPSLRWEAWVPLRPSDEQLQKLGPGVTVSLDGLGYKVGGKR